MSNRKKIRRTSARPRPDQLGLASIADTAGKSVTVRQLRRSIAEADAFVQALTGTAGHRKPSSTATVTMPSSEVPPTLSSRSAPH
jgi:hypothetical protein